MQQNEKKTGAFCRFLASIATLETTVQRDYRKPGSKSAFLKRDVSFRSTVGKNIHGRDTVTLLRRSFGGHRDLRSQNVLRARARVQALY